jgi:hypothetical protein
MPLAKADAFANQKQRHAGASQVARFEPGRLRARAAQDDEQGPAVLISGGKAGLQQVAIERRLPVVLDQEAETVRSQQHGESQFNREPWITSSSA